MALGASSDDISAVDRRNGYPDLGGAVFLGQHRILGCRFFGGIGGKCSLDCFWDQVLLASFF